MNKNTLIAILAAFVGLAGLMWYLLRGQDTDKQNNVGAGNSSSNESNCDSLPPMPDEFNCFTPIGMPAFKRIRMPSLLLNDQAKKKWKTHGVSPAKLRSGFILANVATFFKAYDVEMTNDGLEAVGEYWFWEWVAESDYYNCPLSQVVRGMMNCV